MTEYLARWREAGGCPPRPERFADAVAVAERLLANVGVTALASEEGLPGEPRAAIRVADHTIELLGAGDEGLGGDLVLVDPQGRRHRILEGGFDADQSYVFEPFDGDTVTMRSVLEVVALAVALADLDVDVSLQNEANEDPLDALFDQPVALTQLLLYRAGNGPLVDWRLQGDSVGAGPLRDGGCPRLQAAQPAVASAFADFVRASFDPAYLARPHDPELPGCPHCG